jgi:hypothetical protein
MSSSTAVQHPDYDLIERVYREQDESVPEDWEDHPPNGPDEAHAQMQDAFGDMVDPDSLHASAVRHASDAMAAMLPAVLLGLSDPVQGIAALWASAFLTGVRYQQAGGHTATDG